VSDIPGYFSCQRTKNPGALRLHRLLVVTVLVVYARRTRRSGIQPSVPFAGFIEKN
jgi:hypothetical protein